MKGFLSLSKFALVKSKPRCFFCWPSLYPPMNGGKNSSVTTSIIAVGSVVPRIFLGRSAAVYCVYPPVGCTAVNVHLCQVGNGTAPVFLPHYACGPGIFPVHNVYNLTRL